MYFDFEVLRKIFPTEAELVKLYYKEYRPGMSCPKCESKNITLVDEKGSIQCGKCSSIFSVHIGSNLESLGIDFRVIMLIVHRLAQAGNIGLAAESLKVELRGIEEMKVWEKIRDKDIGMENIDIKAYFQALNYIGDGISLKNRYHLSLMKFDEKYLSDKDNFYVVLAERNKIRNGKISRKTEIEQMSYLTMRDLNQELISKNSEIRFVISDKFGRVNKEDLEDAFPEIKNVPSKKEGRGMTVEDISKKTGLGKTTVRNAIKNKLGKGRSIKKGEATTLNPEEAQEILEYLKTKDFKKSVSMRIAIGCL